MTKREVQKAMKRGLGRGILAVRENPDRYIAVDADQPAEEVTKAAFAALFQRLTDRGVL